MINAAARKQSNMDHHADDVASAARTIDEGDTVELKPVRLEETALDVDERTSDEIETVEER